MDISEGVDSLDRGMAVGLTNDILTTTPPVYNSSYALCQLQNTSDYGRDILLRSGEQIQHGRCTRSGANTLPHRSRDLPQTYAAITSPIPSYNMYIVHAASALPLTFYGLASVADRRGGGSIAPRKRARKNF